MQNWHIKLILSGAKYRIKGTEYIERGRVN